MTIVTIGMLVSESPESPGKAPIKKGPHCNLSAWSSGLQGLSGLFLSLTRSKTKLLHNTYKARVLSHGTVAESPEAPEAPMLEDGMIRETASGLTVADGPITCSEIAQHLERMREQAKLSVAVAAANAGIASELLWAWERGERLIRVQAVLAQFESYGCRIKIGHPKRNGVHQLLPGV